MKILLIAPASGYWRRIGRRRFFNGKTFRFSMLPLLSVAELSPGDAEITLIDEQFQDIPDGHFDVVGITAMTALAPRAYELCAHFRERGIPVVMGGYHATLNPGEALEHADAVVTGPAYGAWQRVCEDIQAGTLQRRYRGDVSLGIPKTVPRQLLDKRQYVTAHATFATMGCRNACRFCSIAKFHESRFFTRPVADVVAEVAAFDSPFFMFVDDNLTQDRDYAMALFEGLAPLGKRWVTQASLTIGDDEALLAAMQRAGCTGVFVGLETFNPDALASQQKAFNTPEKYRTAVAAFHRHGMYVEAGVMVGFDHDSPAVFRETLKSLEQARIDAIQLAIVTPLPGTPLFESMRDRIVDRDWEHYDYRHAVFTPRLMRRDELQHGADWLIRAFYSPWRIARRIPRWLSLPGGWHLWIYPLVLNLAYLGRVIRFGIRGNDPAGQWTYWRRTCSNAIQNLRNASRVRGSSSKSEYCERT
ncbi:MAG TPA: radical SAM protein [Candidatus Hydrogenedentes bacterium]|nr:radical SAM protein [Candidatus Hydrogenedentota bacterium]